MQRVWGYEIFEVRPYFTLKLVITVPLLVLGNIKFSAGDYFLSHVMQLLQYCIKKFEATTMWVERA